MKVQVKPYDAKLLAKRLEVKVGRPVSAHVASTAVNVILKWVQKSAIVSENKIDDLIIPLYPAIISFLSKQIDLKPFKGDFEVEKAFDLKELLAQLEIYGLVVAEEAINDTVEICLAWVIESSQASENSYDDIVAVVIPLVLKPLNDAINGISTDVETQLDLEDNHEEDVQEEIFEDALQEEEKE